MSMPMVARLRALIKRPLGWRQALFLMLRAAPWVVFGPITGFMGERALHCFRNQAPVLGALYIVANISILLGIPTITAVLAARL
jgi:hypothetical protein